MKRFLAVALAAMMMLVGAVEGFAASPSEFTFKTVSEVPFLTEYFSQFDQGNGNYVIPVDVSSTIYADNFLELFSGYFSDSYVPFVSFSSYYSCTLNSQYHSNLPGFTFYFLPKGNVKSCFRKISNYNHYVFSYINYNYNWESSASFIFDSERNVFILNSFVNSHNGYVSMWNSLWESSRTALYFPDETLFSIIPSSDAVTAQLSSCTFLEDISNISIVDYKDYVPPVNDHALTINYLYPNGVAAADPIVQSLAPGVEYSISSPEIAGYTPSVLLVAGTMPEEDLTVDVIYSMSFHTLTVKYQYADGTKAQEDVVLQYPAGFSYDVPTPDIAGYTPDKLSVTGSMPGSDLTETVIYTGKLYTLTVDYLHEDGSQAAESHQEQLSIGTQYSVSSPQIEGYLPSQTAVTGVMPGKDITVMITYRKDSGGSSGAGGSGAGDSGDSGDGENPGWNDFTGYDPFIIPDLPPYTGYDPFKMSRLPSYSYDPFVMPDDWGK